MTRPNEVSASVSWKSPSNLAIVKYWGKQGYQEPLNPSISFSLDKSFTQTTITTKPSDDGGFTFLLDGQKKENFDSKIEQFLNKARPFFPFLKNHHLVIESHNSFPHSSGIASSASAMSALAQCLVSLHQLSQGKSLNNIDKIMVSGVARLGSGSACRSVYGGWSLWGKTPAIANSSNMYAIALENNIHPVFHTLQDTILLVDPTPKKVSSSQGHQLMENHPYRKARIKQANENTEKLLQILASGNVHSFLNLAENEALSLHGLMMSSTPSYTLLHPNTISLMAIIQEKRQKEGWPVGFSLDAGPNIHLLHPASHQQLIVEWIDKDLKAFCHQGNIIYDNLGQGPELIKI